MSRMKILVTFWFVFVLIVTVFSLKGIDATRAVDYTINITDAADDIYGANYDSTTADDVDITSVTSAESGGIVTLTLTVTGTIHGISTAGTYSYSYAFYIDVNNDGLEDWDVFSIPFDYLGDEFYTTLEDDLSIYVYDLTGDDVTGDDTNTFTVKFPLSYITDDISGWDIYGETFVMDEYDSDIWALDTAPDDEFSVDPYADDDSDGMDNWWESLYGLDPNDPADANTDLDNDTYTNYEEYEYDTDPTDISSHPPTLDTGITVTITDPVADETIYASSEYLDYYLITGTAKPPDGESIIDMEWRLPDAVYAEWDWCYDTSSGYDWSTWEAYLPTYFVDGFGFIESGYNKLEVIAITDGSGYNMAEATFYFDTSESEGYGDYEFWSITFSDNSIEIDGPFGVWYDGTFKVQSGKKANLIDIKITDNNEDEYYNGLTLLGVYTLYDDILQISLNEPGNPNRPSANFTDEGSNMVFYLIKESGGLGATELEGSWFGTAVYYYDYLDDTIYEWDELTETYPFTSSPTDSTIEVKIATTTISYQMSWDQDTFYILVKGTTSGVDHCKISFIEFYKDGTYTEEAYWEEEIDIKEFASEIDEYMEEMGIQVEAWHFKPTSNDWLTWEYKINTTFTYEELEDLGALYDITFTEEELAEIYSEFMPVKMQIYVRAYADENETMWNQASYEVNMEQRAGKGNAVSIDFIGESNARIDFEGRGDTCVEPIPESFLDQWQIDLKTLGDDLDHTGQFILIDAIGDTKLEWVNITIEYDPSRLPADINEEDLKIFYYNDGEWIECEVTSVDTQNHLIYANVTHLTIFAPLAEGRVDPGTGDGDTDDEGNGSGPGINFGVILGLIAVVVIVALAAGVIIIRAHRRPGAPSPAPPPAPPEEKKERAVAKEPVEEKEMKESEEDDFMDMEWKEEKKTIYLSELERITKSCPKCSAEIDIEPSFDEKISLVCSQCNARGRIPNPYLNEIERLKEEQEPDSAEGKDIPPPPSPPPPTR